MAILLCFVFCRQVCRARRRKAALNVFGQSDTLASPNSSEMLPASCTRPGLSLHQQQATLPFVLWFWVTAILHMPSSVNIGSINILHVGLHWEKHKRICGRCRKREWESAHKRETERQREILICLLTDFLNTSGLCRRNEEQHTYSRLGNQQSHMESIISSNHSYYPSESPAQVLWRHALESSS